MTDDGERDGPNSGRSAAEWVTFAVSCAVLTVVAGLISLGLFDDDRPAAPTARLAGAVEAVPSGFSVPVEVHNVGDAAAADVQVVAELTIGSEVSESDLLVDFLAADEREQLVFVFADHPDDGELNVRVAGFSEP